MYPKLLLMQSLKTTTLHGCMITKTKNQDACTLQTKYNLDEQENEDSNDDNNKQILCSDLDEIEIALLKDDSGDYELVFDEGPMKTQALASCCRGGKKGCSCKSI
jgi:hypothetical protein